MILFEAPPPTRYDLCFTLAKIPIRVHPTFWLTAILFGTSAGDLIYLPIWIAVVFVSILIHELGHALVMRFYGQPSYVVLHFAGGLTLPEPIQVARGWATVSFKSSQDVLISLAGPGAGFLLIALLMVAIIAVGGSI